MWWVLLVLGFATTGTLGKAQQVAASDTVPKPSPKSPLGAVLRSAVLPGWGQWYVGAYWKAPIFLLGNAVAGYLTIVNHRQYVRYQREVEAARAQGVPTWDLATLQAYRDAYVQRRDLALAAWVAAYILAAVDAYVEAHLAGFDVSERLSFWVRPGSGGIELACRWELTPR